MRSITLTKLFSCFLIAYAVGLSSSRAQRVEAIPSAEIYRENFRVSLKDTVIRLRHQFILPGSESLYIDSTLLTATKEYTIDSRLGFVHLHQNAFHAKGPGDSLHVLAVSYQALPFTFKDSYQRRTPVIRLDTSSGKQIAIGERTKTFSIDDLFGSDLQKSGSIVRGFTVGSNRDLSLNSGFRMQMAGSLSRDISIVAALTDENSPLQPEGTTRTLQEVDKVFVEVRGKNMSATLGDFNLDVSGSEFGRFSRKLQGAKAVASFQSGGTTGELMATGAAPRGKFVTNTFQGLDGVQGPYRLAGQNNERNIIVIAGTEHVYVNGEQMTRGELYDYTIDYAVGEITFTARRLVSATSRITVDFEYTDRQYSRNLVAAQAATSFFNDRFTFGATFLRESDDEDSPIDLTLSDSDKTLMRLAGNDRFKATRSGVDSVGVGKGQYEGVDTLVHLPAGRDSLVRIYRYNPSDTLRAIYAVVFSDVGFGNGEYERVTVTQFHFVGMKQGSYSPIRFLPLPKAQSLADFNVGGKLSSDFKIGGELALSNFDANKFSSLQDDENSGNAMNLALEYTPKSLRLGGTDLGSLSAGFKERFIGKRYVSPDRINVVEFNRLWNITDTSKADEEVREGTLSYKPVEFMTVGGSAGTIRRGDTFSSDRYTGAMKLNALNLPMSEYQLEVIRSRDDGQALVSQWVRHHGTAAYKFWKLTPRIGYNGELLRNVGTPLNQTGAESFRYNEFLSGLALDSLSKISLNAQYALRTDDSLAAGVLTHASSSFTQTYGARLSDWNTLSSALDVTLQKKVFSDAFRRANADNLDGILVRSQTQFNPLDRGVQSDFYYEVATGRSAKMERIFQRVSKGSGNYIYVGDINNNHITDEQDFQLARFDGEYVAVTVPTDQFIPVVDLKTSMSLRLIGDRLVSHSRTWAEDALAALSTETYVRVEEKSSDAEKQNIYLLHLSHFLNDRTTLSGSNLVSQDLFLFENNPAFTLRFRYTQHRGLTQFALATERLYTREQSIRVRWQLIKEFANQTDFILRRDMLASDRQSNRSRDIRGTSFVTDWSYRPEQKVELGFKFSFGQSLNFDSTTVDLNDQSVRLLYSFNERGQSRVDLTREEATFDKPGVSIPFELTGGRLGGKSWLWHLGLDYRITQFIQSSMSYEGRSEGGGHPVHVARAELRAFF